MKVAIVVAHSSNRIIGLGGKLPWHLPGDLRRFKELTTDHAVIMGRKTYDSLPDRFRPLPNRVNVVVSRTAQPSEGVVMARCYNEAVKMAAEAMPESDRIFVIGGESIYQMALQDADEIYITLVEDHVDGDCWFPILQIGQWKLAEQSELHFENDLQYRFLKMERSVR